jgi:hypothetical protein
MIYTSSIPLVLLDVSLDSGVLEWIREYFQQELFWG